MHVVWCGGGGSLCRVLWASVGVVVAFLCVSLSLFAGFASGGCVDPYMCLFYLLNVLHCGVVCCLLLRRIVYVYDLFPFWWIEFVYV